MIITYKKAIKYKYKLKIFNMLQKNLILSKKILHINYIISWFYYGNIQQEYQLKDYLIQKITLKNYKYILPFWKSEIVFQYFKRNVSIIVHTPRIFSLVEKLNQISVLNWRHWRKINAATLIFGFSTGRCGFKSNETKSFIAIDTLIRAILWFLSRFSKTLSPIKVRFIGHNLKFSRFFNRLLPLNKKKLKYNFYSFSDHTPIPFNGCRLSHLPRKRYRRHAFNVKKIVQYVKKFKVSL